MGKIHFERHHSHQAITTFLGKVLQIVYLSRPYVCSQQR
jgi:hypothetical protein